MVTNLSVDLPEELGAGEVVLDREGLAWQRKDRRSWRAVTGQAVEMSSWAHLVVDRGPLTLLAPEEEEVGEPFGVRENGDVLLMGYEAAWLARVLITHSPQTEDDLRRARALLGQWGGKPPVTTPPPAAAEKPDIERTDGRSQSDRAAPGVHRP